MERSGEDTFILDWGENRFDTVRTIDMLSWLRQTTVAGVRLEKFMRLQRVTEGIADVADPTLLAAPRFLPAATHPFQWVLHIPGGSIVGPNGLVVTPDGYLLSDVVITGDVNHHLLSTSVKRRAFYTRRRLTGTTGLIASHGEKAFFHWVFDMLPRIALLEQADAAVAHIAPGRIRFPAHLELLKQAGVSEESIVEFGPNVVLQCETLLVPSFLSSTYLGEGLFVEPEIIEWVRRRLRMAPPVDVPPRPSAAGRRLYLSRANLPERHILNDGDVKSELERFGFEEICPEQYPIWEQQRLMSEAEAVIGVHGSAFANWIFCPAGAAAIEIRPWRFHDHNFSRFAESLGLRYFSFETGGFVDQKRISVDVHELEVFLEGIFGKPQPPQTPAASGTKRTGTSE